MESLIKTLNDLTPVIIVLGLAFFMTVERLIPYFEHGGFRKKQRLRNLGMVGIAFVLNALVGATIAGALMWSEQHQVGLLYHLPVPAVVTTIIGILLVDLNSYVLHRFLHKIPFLWRIHQVHHSDVELDSTSGLRLHPFEFLLQAATQALFLPLAGVSIASFVLYFTVALPWFLLNHSNIKFPDWFERYAPWLLVTPNWHRVHHSSYQPETDSHFSDVFTVWDRLFGTVGDANVEEIQFGLEDFRQPEDQSVGALLGRPFKKP